MGANRLYCLVMEEEKLTMRAKLVNIVESKLVVAKKHVVLTRVSFLVCRMERDRKILEQLCLANILVANNDSFYHFLLAFCREGENANVHILKILINIHLWKLVAQNEMKDV